MFTRVRARQSSQERIYAPGRSVMVWAVLGAQEVPAVGWRNAGGGTGWQRSSAGAAICAAVATFCFAGAAETLPSAQEQRAHKRSGALVAHSW